MKTVRLTAAQATFRYLAAQLNEDGVPFLAGCWAIFGHGNVAGIGEALHAIGDDFPTWRGHNEQGIAHAAVAYAKALKPQAGDGGDHLDRPRRAQPRHRLRHGARQPPAGAVPARRRLRQPDAGPGPAAARGLQRRHNLLDTARYLAEPAAIDFAAHAASMGAAAEQVGSIAELEAAMARARRNDRSTVLVIDTDPLPTTAEGGHWWDVAVPEVSTRREVQEARRKYEARRELQRQD
jgi:TPP-dependent trihydroxycyclohexane-1,2-dione (THcHDO) dehydratase